MPAAEPAFWQRRGPIAWLLSPLSLLFLSFSGVRRWLFAAGLIRSWRAPVPVLIVGNITVGGAGKTPLTLAIARMLAERQARVGIVTRGYRGTNSDWPLAVEADTSATLAGDEAVLLARRARVPVVAGPDRVSAVRHLLQRNRCDIVLSDDGLQHYRLLRDAEIVVVSAARGFGNRLPLPAGPLREPESRLQRADLVIESGAERRRSGYQLIADRVLISVNDWRSQLDCSTLLDTRIHAVAGIARPASFFATLREIGLQLIEHPFPDHHRFSSTDLAFDDDLPVVMTEKDAVKCTDFERQNLWFLRVHAELDNAARADIERILDRLLGDNPEDSRGP